MISRVYKFLLLFFLLLLFFSHSKALNIYDTTNYKSQANYLKTYYKKKPDSLFPEHLKQIIQIIENKKIQKSVENTKKYLFQIDVNQMLHYLQTLVDSLKKEKEKYNIYREIKTISKNASIQYYDSVGIGSSDSSFVDFLDQLLQEEDTLTDKPVEISPTTTYFPDSLITAIRAIKRHIENDSVFLWLGKHQNDTIELYIRNLENDSTLIKLYDNNMELINFNITDFWGTEISAVVREIKQNSFKLLIDDTPEIENKAGEKAKQLLEKQKEKHRFTFDTQLEKRQVPDLSNPWSFYGNAGLDATQILLHQWNKGGQSSIAFLANVELYLKYKKYKHNLDSYAKFKLGLIRQGEYRDKKAHFETNNDRIDLQLKYGYQAFGKKISATFFGNFKTQFAPSYNYLSDTSKILVSQFFSPAYLTFAIGIDYKPKSNMSIFFSPLTAKTTTVLNPEIDETKYGLEKGKTYRNEIGTIFKGYLKNKVWGNIIMENTLELFSNYVHKPQNIDINWEMKLLFPINDYIKTTFSTHFIYDDDEKITKKNKDNILYESKGGQFKQMLMIGFYVFF